VARLRLMAYACMQINHDIITWQITEIYMGSTFLATACTKLLCAVDCNASIPTQERKAIRHDDVLELDRPESRRININGADGSCA
jgi:hypothetical protein